MSQSPRTYQESIVNNNSIVITEFKVLINEIGSILNTTINTTTTTANTTTDANTNTTNNSTNKNTNTAANNATLSSSGVVEKKRMMTQVLPQTTNEISKGFSNFKTRYVQLRTNELLIYAINDQLTRKLKANISLIKANISNDTLYNNCIRIETLDKIVHIQIDSDELRHEWLKSMREQTQFLSKRKEEEHIANALSLSMFTNTLSNTNTNTNTNTPSVVDASNLTPIGNKEPIISSVNDVNGVNGGSSSSVSVNGTITAQQVIIENFITQVNSLDPKKYFNPSSNLSATPSNNRRQRKFKSFGEISGLNNDSLHGIKFNNDDDGQLKDNDQDLNNHVKDQLSILTTEFSHLNNFTFVGGLAHLTMIGNRIMGKASIEANTQSILNMTGGSQILKQGYLLKAGPNSHQPWKKRYCVLTEACEFRYMSKIGQAPKGLFSLKGAWASRINTFTQNNTINNNTQNNTINNNTINNNTKKNGSVSTSIDSDTFCNSDENFNQAFNTFKNAFQFQIETSERIFKFQAPSYQSLKSWLQSLDKIGCKVKIDENDGIIKTGYLMKEGTSVMNSNKRFIVLLESNELKYYGKKGGELKGTIDLENSFITKINEKLNFTIHTPEKIHVFKAENEIELELWIENISKYGAIQRKETDPNPIFKNRLEKYYLKTTEQVIIERQEKLQDYIVSEDALRSKLERNKNNSSFCKSANNSFHSITSNCTTITSGDMGGGMSGGMSSGIDQSSHLTVNKKGNCRTLSESSLSPQMSTQLFSQSLLKLKPGETPTPPSSHHVNMNQSTSSSLILNISIPQVLEEEENDDEYHVEQLIGIEPIEKYIPNSVESLTIDSNVNSKESIKYSIGDSEVTVTCNDDFQIEDLTQCNNEIETINNIDNTDDTISIKSMKNEQFNPSLEELMHDMVHDDEECETNEEEEISSFIEETSQQYKMSNPPQRFHITQIIPNLNPTIVIDNGSGILKSGFSNQDFPTCVFNNMIGRLKHYATRGFVGKSLGEGKLYFGDGAQSLRGVLQLSHPVERGIVKNFDDFEMMLQYCQDCLKLETFSEHPLLITESPINPKQNRERTTQMMFETFDTPYLYMAKSSVLSLFAHGHTTGLVLDSGDGVTHTVPIYEGYSLPHAIQRLELAGKDLTSYMLNLLNQSGQSKHFNSSSAIEIVRCLKEDLCFVKSKSNTNTFNSNGNSNSGNNNSNNSNGNNNNTNGVVEYSLPDGSSVSITEEERYKCPELLFNPSIINNGEMLGVHELCKKTIYDCDIDLRRVLASNIFLSGGSTKFNGFQSRLQEEVQNLLPLSNKVRVKGSKDVQFLPWIGGCIVSNISRFPYDCISRQEYEETGPHYSHVKFM